MCPVKLYFSPLHDFYHIHSFVCNTGTYTLTNAFIHSDLDFRNNLFFGLTKYSIHRLQKMQNTVAYIVANISYFFHKTPTLKFLHLASNILSY